MTGFYQKDNLTPSLLDRLTDDAPRRRSENKSFSILSSHQYRKKVLRDILYLLNSNTLFSYEELEFNDIPENVTSSTINYGTPALSGMIVSNIDWIKVEKDIMKSLISFEDRLEKDSVKVIIHLDAPTLVHESELIIEIYGKLKMTQYDQEFWLKTKVDVETGVFSLLENNNE